MSGSTYGKFFTCTTYGESHGVALGVVIDGCPAGLSLTEEDIQKDLDRRKPGNSNFATKRAENDKVKIQSGVFEGKTTGTPISLCIFNEDQHSKDYTNIKNTYRPGHADFCFDEKYGFRDYRGGGRSSGRETAARVAAGAVARKILSELGINVVAYSLEIGGVNAKNYSFDVAERFNNELVMPSVEGYKKASEIIREAMENEDSIGGVVECVISGVKAGVGEPVFNKLDAMLSHGIMSLGAFKGIEFGTGFQVANKKGSENNDSFYIENNKVMKKTNNSGGILGGMSDGSDIIFRAPVKPTSSIHKTQNTVNNQLEEVEINVKGRHDPIIVARSVVVVEAMSCITLLDLIMENSLSKMENLKKLYLS